MLLQIGLLILGLALVVFGADWLVDGASAIARKSGISEFVIGLTIVGFGTSCPELVVSLTGAFKGIADISIGNVVGSNILNTLLILGLTGVIAPIAITAENRKRDIPLTILVTVLLIAFGLWNKDISRLEGIVFLLLFAGYIFYCFKTDSASVEMAEEKNLRLGVAILLDWSSEAAFSSTRRPKSHGWPASPTSSSPSQSSRAALPCRSSRPASSRRLRRRGSSRWATSWVPTYSIFC